MGREAVRDLSLTSDFDEIVVADKDVNIDRTEARVLQLGHKPLCRPHVFLDYGLTSEEPFRVDGTALSPRTFLRAHLLNRSPALDSPVAFFLRVDVIGKRDHHPVAISYRSAHPTDWGSAGTARMTGVPMSIALQAMARGEVARTGVLGPEAAFSPESMFAQLRARGVSIVRD
ncbi:MAG: hypothetical protein M3082_22355 [Candidatus Dormibacteraeota bacterium]|nr:hypothetical protein [Candidatus Dormibacteraeota bacterium]